jgi:hypothetical protein
MKPDRGVCSRRLMSVTLRGSIEKGKPALLAVICWLIGFWLLLPAGRPLLSLLEREFSLVDESPHRNALILPATPTPFQPSPLSQVFVPFVNRAAVEISESEPITRSISDWHGIDFSPGAQQITLRITPPDQRINAGRTLELAFLPSDRCEFGDGQACVYPFLTNRSKRVIFTSIHSGVGGEGEIFRHALEGTGFNRGLFSPEKILENALTLAGAQVTLKQGNLIRSDFKLVRVIRIPPGKLDAYYASPVEDTLGFALDSGLLEVQDLNQDLLVLETCGWRLPGEAWANGVSDTTGSVYLVLIPISE